MVVVWTGRVGLELMEGEGVWGSLESVCVALGFEPTKSPSELRLGINSSGNLWV